MRKFQKRGQKEDMKSIFISKLADDDGEQQKTQRWLEVAFDYSYIEKNILDNLLKRNESVEKMLYSMIDKSNLFCKE